jgi:glycosyltransferase involved in cell wall biosynthesis
MTARVYFYPAGRIYSSQWDLINHPPAGYEFVTDPTLWDRAVAPIVQHDGIYFPLAGVLSGAVPLHLAKAYLEGFFKRIPKDVAIVYAYNHPVFHKVPWVVHVEWATILAGFHIRHLRRYRGIIERLLASPWCRGVLTWSEAARRSILHHLDCSRFGDKIEVVNLAIRKQDFTKRYGNTKVKLLFVGSANTRRREYDYNFHIKGGKETLEAFRILRQRYDNLELVLRTDVPPEVKAHWRGTPGLRIIDTVIPREELEREFQTADIFVFPSHQMTVWGVLLEAMSYELPVVTTDVYANGEVVRDGVTGLLVPGALNVPYYTEPYVQFAASNLRSNVNRVIRDGTDLRLAHALVEKVGLLIENADLRRQMGKSGRREIEQGGLSIAKRNAKLKRILDRATQGSTGG